MARGKLSEEKRVEISALLPDTNGIRNKVWRIVRDQLIIGMGVDLSITDAKYGISLVCLQDAGDVVLEVGHALYEAYANRIWFREESPEAPVDFLDAFYAKFYCDDAALRLYAAGEHVAAFIKAFLTISNTDLAPYQKRKWSEAKKIGQYMIDEKPGHRITGLVQSLITNQDWQQTWWYRNRWVHQQPPLVSGQGIVFKRRGAWKVSEDGNTFMFVGVGDPPEYEVEEALEMVTGASHAFVGLLSELADIFFDHLESLGLELPEE